MKAELVFEAKQTWSFRFGRSATIHLNCYRICRESHRFDKAYVFGWIAFDPKNPARRILVDQHRGRPCHLHIEETEIILNRQPANLEEAFDLFRDEVIKYFGEILETK